VGVEKLARDRLLHSLTVLELRAVCRIVCCRIGHSKTQMIKNIYTVLGIPIDDATLRVMGRHRDVSRDPGYGVDTEVQEETERILKRVKEMQDPLDEVDKEKEREAFTLAMAKAAIQEAMTTLDADGNIDVFLARVDEKVRVPHEQWRKKRHVLSIVKSKLGVGPGPRMQCPVCYTEDATFSFSKSCGHVICQLCITKWGQRSGCPQCRAPLQGWQRLYPNLTT
jgi:hypothetical protein